MEKIVIATRESALALWQAYHIKEKIESLYPNLKVELNKMTSNGDKVLDRPLALIGGKGHFTKELEDAMLEGRADMAVHSLKDVPTFIPKGLSLAAITKREDQSDVFLSHKYKTLESLPIGAKVGTTSLRRRMQILAIRPDLKIKDLRGNVNTRLRKLEDGEYDAIILAYIGLFRLDLLKHIPYVQKLEFMIPPMGQAALGIEIVDNNSFLQEVAKTLNDEESFLLTSLERDFVAQIGAGCSAPVATNATMNNGKVSLKAMIGYPDGTHILEKSIEADKKMCHNIGFELAKEMIESGAKEILENAENLAFKDERCERI
ncbi:MAG: hydroxymethylbilane synthase [Epsilonproteobacteria bacterium]|nr:hydroxymethylbilane synthase [Campylobacterota bacterium]